MGLFVRLLWFVFVGWWLGLVWFGVSLLLMISIIGFPIGAYTATKTWHVMTFKTKPQRVVVEARQQKS